MGTLLGLSHMLFSMASDGLRNTSKWGEGEMVKLLLDTIQDRRDRSEGVREKAGPRGDSTVQSRSSKGNAVAGEYRAPLTVFRPDGPVSSSQFGLMGSHWSRVRPCEQGRGTVWAGGRGNRPSLLVLNDLETEITPRLPFKRLLAA